MRNSELTYSRVSLLKPVLTVYKLLSYLFKSFRTVSLYGDSLCLRGLDLVFSQSTGELWGLDVFLSEQAA